MSIFQCENCGCAENTAFGWYHCREDESLTKPEFLGKKLCSACGPTHFPNGEPIEKMGKWHCRFERVFYPIGSMETDRNGNLAKKQPHSAVQKEGEMR